MTGEALHDTATWREIMAQPGIWAGWAAPLAAAAAELRDWIAARGIGTVWLSGAGTSAFAGEILDVVEGLPAGLVEVLAGGFVFGEEAAFPEEVDTVVGALDGADRLLEAGNGAAVEAEHVEKGVPEGFGLGGFAGFAGPLAGEGDGAGLDLCPTQRHGSKNSRGSEF